MSPLGQPLRRSRTRGHQPVLDSLASSSSLFDPINAFQPAALGQTTVRPAVIDQRFPNYFRGNNLYNGCRYQE